MRRFWAATLVVLAGMLSIQAPASIAGGLLVVAPHPDDDLLIAAGLIANAKARGDQVKVVFMTNGDSSGVSAGLAREGEAVLAQIENLGTAEDDLIFLGYPDGGLSLIYNNYPNVTDVYWGLNNRSTTYGSRGLGRADYHTFKFGSPALYNRANVVTDLQSVISTYLPDHIVTTAEFDKHPDHATTFQLVKQAVSLAVAAHSGYNPGLHKSIVWSSPIDQSPVWPELPNPKSYNVAPPGLPATQLWADRESLDVPAAMQSTNLSTNPKYKAIDDHISQGGASSFLGRFVHMDEFFWIEALQGTTSPPKAAAGVNQVVAAGASVQLNGTGSANPGGGGLTYSWRQIGGPVVILSGSTSANPTFQAPINVSQDTVLSFELVVRNAVKASLPDLVSISVTAGGAVTQNLAPQSTVTASSQNSADGQLARKAVDGVADGYPGDYTREWATQGEGVGAWLQLQWSTPVTISRIVLFDRPNTNDFITGGVLNFSDGSSLQVPALINGGGGQEVTFAARTVSSVKFTVTSVAASSRNVGLSEIQAFGTSAGQSVNNPPVANAGAAQTVASGAAVQLDGTGSSDPEGSALTYLWQQTSGNTVALTGATTVRPTFTAPANLAQNATLMFSLVVSDGAYNSSPSTVTVVITASQPAVNVASQASVVASSQNSADGQLASKVIDGVADGYPGDYLREWASQGERVGAWIELRWPSPVSINKIVLFDRPNAADQITGGTLSFSDGSSIPVSALNNEGAASETAFSARTVTSVRLTVTSVLASTQNVGLSEMQVFSAGGVAGNQLPFANAGPAQTVGQGVTVQLDGSSSADPEGAALTYLWRQVGGPAVTPSNTAVVRPTFVSPTGLSQNTVLSFELTVNDGQATSVPSIVNITVSGSQASINLAPQATVLASTENTADGQLAVKAVDGVISGYPGDYTREWATRGERAGAWIELRWTAPVLINRVVLYDRPNVNDQITSGTLTFSDGSTVAVSALNNAGTATQFTISPRTVTSVRLSITGAASASQNIGLSEFEVFGTVAP